MSISKNKIKYLQSLKLKKQRDIHGTFVAEGEKLVSELLNFCKCQYIAGLPHVVENIKSNYEIEEIVVATEQELKKASHLKTSSPVIAVFYQLQVNIDDINFDNNLHLVLDGIQDPGNMGTIVRLADWFGIQNIICSEDTVDIFNPKTVQATMGAVARVNVIYTNLPMFLEKHNTLPVYGTFLEGNNIYEEALSNSGFIVMGNEGQGVTKEVESLVTSKLYIPSFAAGGESSESLNVAVATAIVCSEFRRRGRV